LKAQAFTTCLEHIPELQERLLILPNLVKTGASFKWKHNKLPLKKKKTHRDSVSKLAVNITKMETTEC